MNPPCSDRVGLTGPVCNRQFIHHSRYSNLDPARLQTAVFPVPSRPSLLVNLPAATLALIESRQTPPPLQLTDWLFVIGHTKCFYPGINRLDELCAAVGRSGSIPSRGPESPIMIGPLYRRHLPAKQMSAVPMPSQPLSRLECAFPPR